MPLYEYQCGRCDRFELIRKFSDPPLEACPTCGGPVQKQFSAPAIQFKGTGWYVTDYARKPAGGDASSKGEEASKGGEAGKRAEAGKGAEKPSASGDGNGASKDGAGSPKATPSQDSSTPGGGSTKSRGARGS